MFLLVLKLELFMYLIHFKMIFHVFMKLYNFMKMSFETWLCEKSIYFVHPNNFLLKLREIYNIKNFSFSPFSIYSNMHMYLKVFSYAIHFCDLNCVTEKSVFKYIPIHVFNLYFHKIILSTDMLQNMRKNVYTNNFFRKYRRLRRHKIFLL